LAFDWYLTLNELERVIMTADPRFLCGNCASSYKTLILYVDNKSEQKLKCIYDVF